MHPLRVSLASVAFLALQAAAQIGEYNPIYSDYDYCQGITPTAQTYQPMAGATLKKVQLFMRHGDRVPSMVFPGDDANYNLCGNSLENHYSGNDHLARTPTTFNVGKSIRSIYVDMLKFLPKFLKNDTLYVRNTYVVRTRESAEHMLNGLYPSLFRVPETVVEMNAYPEAVENILISKNVCPALPDLFKRFTATPAFLNFYKSNYPLMVKTNNILGVANNPSYNNTLNGDFFMPRLCNNMPLPCSRTNATDCITPAEATRAMTGTWVMAYGPLRFGPEAEKAKRVSGGMFVGTIPKNIRATLKGDPSSRPFEFFSVHDQSIDQIMAIVSSPDGKPVQAHPDLKCSLDACPLDVFADFLESFVPSDPKAECGF
ncbi:Acid phosphatase-like protein 2 [Linnemannia exigua]|uniref:Acid phosphatase-like protein 2 n=1 Tax=Linnemannia exigua TaxID=604196 RepID=A0AAD4DJL9_9FUNG|nr:Acid phosphatase-like protein 2 [Linnemannia exigua]